MHMSQYMVISYDGKLNFLRRNCLEINPYYFIKDEKHTDNVSDLDDQRLGLCCTNHSML